MPEMKKILWMIFAAPLLLVCIDMRFLQYHSKYPLNNGDHLCLYRYANESRGRARHIVPYCIRLPNPSSMPTFQQCYGKNFTFIELKRMHVNAQQLMNWYAPIDLISDYQMFLIDNITTSGFFCNCSLFRITFGSHCQYSTEFMKTSFEELIQTTLEQRAVNDIRKLTEEKDVTCYVELNCTTYTGFCLDWRQICDGRRDCLDGRDEQRCIEKELHECNDKREYRCLSGHCIPRAFTFDTTPDCPDADDEQQKSLIFLTFSSCTLSASAYCEERSCGLDKFSCGDGDCRGERFDDVSDRSCTNHRNTLLIKRIYAFDNSSSETCWRFMICHLGLSCLYESSMVIDTACKLSTSGPADFCKRALNYSNSCPSTNEFFFPKKLKGYPSIHLVYNTNSGYPANQNNFNNFADRPMICYNASIYHIKPWLSRYSPQMVGEYHCYSAADFNLQDWRSKGNGVQRASILFHGLANIFLHQPDDINYKNLHKCKTGMWISPHRLADKNYDCFPSDDDESFDTETCAWNLTNRFECSVAIDHRRKCIPRRQLNDGFIHCVGALDEFFPIDCTSLYDCQYLRNVDLNGSFPITYEEFCNGISIGRTTMITEDEIDCDTWPCQTRAHRCDGVWNRPNGCDELDCPGTISNYLSREVANCSNKEHYCLQYNQSSLSCLPITQAGDGKIDCLFGMDERTTVGIRIQHFVGNEEAPFQREHLGWCLNSTKTVGYKQLCDRISHCPLGDDEGICSWNSVTNCHATDEFSCKNQTCISQRRRCDSTIDCWPEGEDEWGCDLRNVKAKYSYRLFTLNGFDVEPLPKQLSSVGRFLKLRHTPHTEDNNLIITRATVISHCHRGIFLRTLNGDNFCLCPPSYYGHRCQFQSERLSIIFQSEIPYVFDQNTVYHLIFILFNTKKQMLSSEKLIYVPVRQSNIKHLIYLIYPRNSMRSRNDDLFIHIEAYRATPTDVGSIALAWYFPLQFSFLPVNRLVLNLDLESVEFGMKICPEQECVHGQCVFYANDREKYFCSCFPGWSGLTCEEKQTHDPCLTLSCNHTYSKCIVHNDQAMCLCKLGRIGHHCYIPYDACSNVRCENGGQCVSIDERTLAFVCLCLPDYFGNRCEFRKARLTIQIPSSTDYIPSVIIHFLTTTSNSPGVLTHQSTYFFRHVHPNTRLTIVDNQQQFLPSIILMQSFVDIQSNYGNYFLLAFLNPNRTDLIKTFSQELRCLHVNERLPASIREFKWMKRVKYYHLYFKDVRCFYDEIYMCFIDRNQSIDCLLFNHNVAHCKERNYCLNDGRCLEDKQMGQILFSCVCPECYYGIFCQFTMAQYSLTLDSILGQQILLDKPLNQQSLFVKVLLGLTIALVFLGFISNSCSTLTFCHADIRKNGSGCYLLILSICSQISLILVLCRFSYLLISQTQIITNRHFLKINCMLFEFVFQLSISLCDWLAACVACERTASVVRGIHFNQVSSVRMVRIIIPILFVTLILLTVHYIFTSTLISDPRLEERLWCVSSYSLHWLQSFSAILNLFRVLVPFLINLISAIVLLVLFSRLKQKTAKKSYFSVLKQQIKKHKDLILSPVLMIACKMPIMIVIIIIKCIKHRWQLYLSTASYFLSVLPLTATFFIFVFLTPSFMRKFIDQWNKVLRRR